MNSNEFVDENGDVWDRRPRASVNVVGPPGLEQGAAQAVTQGGAVQQPPQPPQQQQRPQQAQAHVGTVRAGNQSQSTGNQATQDKSRVYAFCAVQQAPHYFAENPNCRDVIKHLNVIQDEVGKLRQTVAFIGHEIKDVKNAVDVMNDIINDSGINILQMKQKKFLDSVNEKSQELHGRMECIMVNCKKFNEIDIKIEEKFEKSEKGLQVRRIE